VSSVAWSQPRGKSKNQEIISSNLVEVGLIELHCQIIKNNIDMILSSVQLVEAHVRRLQRYYFQLG
jgi:hypothetical protein